jgi:hypothetical protein
VTVLTLEDIQKRIDEVDASQAIEPVALDLEGEARRSIEQERGSAYTDAEWSEARRNLTEFFGVLAEWDRR